jgi:hypothetical protein
MTRPIPTVDDLLAGTAIGCGLHEWWGADGGVIRIARDDLRQALEDACDPSMPDWPSMVEIDA